VTTTAVVQRLTKRPRRSGRQAPPPSPVSVLSSDEEEPYICDVIEPDLQPEAYNWFMWDPRPVRAAIHNAYAKKSAVRFTKLPPLQLNVYESMCPPAPSRAPDPDINVALREFHASQALVTGTPCDGITTALPEVGSPISLSPSQEAALSAIRRGFNVLVHGPGHCGKRTLIEHVLTSFGLVRSKPSSARLEATSRQRNLPKLVISHPDICNTTMLPERFIDAATCDSTIPPAAFAAWSGLQEVDAADLTSSLSDVIARMSPEVQRN
jgi:hypothetical protein